MNKNHMCSVLREESFLESASPRHGGQKEGCYRVHQCTHISFKIKPPQHTAEIQEHVKQTSFNTNTW